MTHHKIQAGQDFDAVEAVRQFPEDDKVAIGYAAAQLHCAIEVNFPGLDRDPIENLAIQFACRLIMAQQDR